MRDCLVHIPGKVIEHKHSQNRKRTQGISTCTHVSKYLRGGATTGEQFPVVCVRVCVCARTVVDVISSVGMQSGQQEHRASMHVHC